MRPFLAFFVGLLIVCGFTPPCPALAIPVFAHRYGFSCQACHTTVPHLNAFGERFLADGYRMAGIDTRGVFPIAVKANLAYSSEPDAGRLPKATVDEIELLSGGAVTKNISYFAETYVVDGGRPGAVRDAWIAYRVPRPVLGVVPFTVAGGQFTLPLPVDPETFRETSEHYAVFDQTGGDNPFTFFEPKLGAQATFGRSLRGTSVTLAALKGHDRQSGLAADGVDRMVYAQHVAGPIVVSAYRYDGERPLQPRADRFWRQGYGVSFVERRWTIDAVLQNGFDGSADGTGAGALGSGGFVQLRYAFQPGLFGILRFDGTTDPASGLYRSVLVGGGVRATRNSRFTFEDVITHVPQAKHTFNAALLLAY